MRRRKTNLCVMALRDLTRGTSDYSAEFRLINSVYKTGIELLQPVDGRYI
jgi:hypothetical protein